MASTIELQLRPQNHDTTEADSDNGSTTPFTQELLPTTRGRQIIVLLSCFMAVFQTIGINQAYGVFQSFYTNPPHPSISIIPPHEASNKALVAFVGTLGAGLTWGGSIFVNPLMARTSDLQRITMLGALGMGVGYWAASFGTRLWHLLMTQGLLYGLSSSMLYFPLLSIAPEYFSAHRGAAMGFILSGAGVGGLVMAPLTQALLTRLGIRWTLRTLGLINLIVGIAIALATSPSRYSGRARRPTLVDVKVAKKPAFVLQATAAILQASGNFVPLTFLPDFSVALGYTAAFSALLLALNNGVNSASRILMGIVADKAGRQNTLVLSVLGSAVSVWTLWLGAAVDGARGLWIAFVVVYGLTAGGYNALFPTTITEVFGIQAYASVNGFIYFVRGLGAFFGSPVGGAILGNQSSSQNLKDFRKLIWYDTALLFGSSVCVIAVRGFDAWEKKMWRWKA